MSPIMDLSHIYNVSLHKLHSFQVTRRDTTDGLRKLVLINSFVYNKFVAPEEYEPLEWSDEDVKRDEQNWLEACLDDLNQEEDEDGYVYISRSEDTASSAPVRTTADETTIAAVAEDIIRPTIFVEAPLEPAPPDLSAYRPFFDSALQQALPKLNMIVGAPRFYQKFCLDRDYLAGISVDWVDGALTSDPILDFIIAETRRYDAVKRSKDDLDIITKEKWIVQRLVDGIESGRIWSIDGYESGRRQKMACF
ncbi:11159_t:CDS:2 [Paraglomus brasilianum]|uniref:11159_t:CDS:1 n=1 Tax=Paraglomus brasilianum TaxID=144538 RepID=A0A9N8VSG5_9GLOM|nr:11159_t:CDS:2 [Paraglomus brasilianum]